MSDAEMYARVEQLDADLVSTPLFLRPIDIYNTLFPAQVEETQRLANLEKITAWFMQRYGSGFEWDGKLCEEPLLIKGQIHSFDVYCAGRAPDDHLKNFLDRLRGPAGRLSEQEYHYVAKRTMESSCDFSALQNMELTPWLLSAQQRDFWRRAWFDLRGASKLLCAASDIQGSIVHSHEAAEKFLKVALLHEGVPARKIGRGQLVHDLSKILQKLESLHYKYGFLQILAADLADSLDSMSMRYQAMRRAPKDAVEAFALARRCCGFIAQQIYLDYKRSAKDIELKVNHYYENYEGSRFRFCGYRLSGQVKSAMLYLLGFGSGKNTLDGLFSFKLPCSFHYFPIVDTMTIAQLETRFHEIMAKAPDQHEKSGPPDIAVEMNSDKYGSGIVIKAPVGHKIWEK